MKLSAMIEEVRREVAMRENVYPRQVAAGKLAEKTAARRLELMRRVQGFLEDALRREAARP